MKRSRSLQSSPKRKTSRSESPHLSPLFLEKCRNSFTRNPLNVMARNSVVTVGSHLSTIDPIRSRDVSHVFLNSLKRPKLKATNQGASGRCWMFAGLNAFRHALIHFLDLENFEFSETYLFFWDKLERSNVFLQWFIDNPNQEGSRLWEYMLMYYTGDGGWWNYFANLVSKYGVIPKCAMPETYQSDDSGDMNRLWMDHLTSCASHLSQSLPYSVKMKLKKKTLQQVYNLLVKFLGEPPLSFNWFYSTIDGEPNAMIRVSPSNFTNMIFSAEIDIKDFVVLANLPSLKYREVYRINNTSNMTEGKECTFLNLTSAELKRFARTSILGGCPVWFAGDVMRGFEYTSSALDERLMNTELVFGKLLPFDKGERVTFRNIQATHAMVLVGVNLDHQSRPVSWQVENSWGYYDHETEGLDGFMYMSDEWFDKYLIEIAVHRRFLSRTINKLFKKEPRVLEPWDGCAPALCVRDIDRPKDYMRKLRN